MTSSPKGQTEIKMMSTNLFSIIPSIWEKLSSGGVNVDALQNSRCDVSKQIEGDPTVFCKRKI